MNVLHAFLLEQCFLSARAEILLTEIHIPQNAIEPGIHLCFSTLVHGPD